MAHRISSILVLALLVALPVAAQETPQALTDAYGSLADTILAVRDAESGLVRAILDGHLHAAEVLMAQGDHAGAAAHIALFASEGDNGVGGVRKRLLEGGHHFNAAGEEQGIYEPGFVVVTREAKERLLVLSQTVRQDEAGRAAAWEEFTALAGELLAAD